MIEQVSYTKTKAHRGTVRLWIEGVKLKTAGFARGVFYDRVINSKTGDITLKLNPEGKYKVSGRKRNNVDLPIIDMALGKDTVLVEGTRLRAVFMQGLIQISVHHEEDNQTRREDRLKSHLKTGKVIHASACTGGGISTAAVHEAIEANALKSNTAWVVDEEIKYLQSAYANNFSITDKTVCFESKLEELETQFLTEVDVLSFSLPCAGLSLSGKSKHKLSAEEHESGTSLFGIRDIIKASNPAVLMSENVPQAQGSAIYVLLIQELKRLGYTIFERVLNNSQTGTFENRRRYWFMAVSNGVADVSMQEIFDFQMERPYAILNDLLDEDVPESVWAENVYLKAKAVRDKDAGKGFAKRQLLSGLETSIGAIGRYYNKRRSTEPFVTRADLKERLLTLVEHAKAKSIPQSLIKHCNNTHGHEILGQSIDYRQAFAPMYHLIFDLKAKYA